MAVSNQIREWWTKALLGEQLAAHPIFGRSIRVKVEGDILTLSGWVETAEQADEVAQEAERLESVRAVVNHLKVVGPEEPQHMQTIIAVFANEEDAELACQAVGATWQSHEGHDPVVLSNRDDAERLLRQRARQAEVDVHAIDGYLRAIDKGKALFMDRVPEDDAFRILSALEGSDAELTRTLPPEPTEVG